MPELVTNVLLLAQPDVDLSGVEESDDVAVVRFDDATQVAAAFEPSPDAAVIVSDRCPSELRADLATIVGKLDCRVIEVQGEAAHHGDPLSAACSGVIAGFGVAAGVSAALAALRA